MISLCQGQRLKTYFLPPSVPSYETRETYFLGVTSNRKDLCVGNWLGETTHMLIPNGVDAFEKVGMHEFIDYSPTFGYDLKLGELYANMSLYVFVNPLISPGLIMCFTSNISAEYCLYGIDRIAVEHLMNVTFVIPPYHYIPEWAFIILMVSVIVVLPMVLFFFYYMYRKRNKTIYMRSMAIGSSHEVVERFQKPQPIGHMSSDDDPFMHGEIYLPVPIDGNYSD